MKICRQIALSLSCLLMTALVARAAVIVPNLDASLTGIRNGTGNTVTIGANSYNGPQSAGLFFWSNQSPINPDLVDVVAPVADRDSSFSGGALQSGAQNFISFCIELTQTVSIPTNYTGLQLVNAADAPIPGTGGVSPMGIQGENYLASLAGNFLVTALASGASLNDRIAAFQIAAWKLTYDGDNGTYANRFSLASGNFKSTGGASALAQTWLDAVKAWDLSNSNLGNNALNGPFRPVYAITKTNGSTFQDQLVFAAGSFADVPEPATLAMWAVGGAIGLVLSQRRRKS